MSCNARAQAALTALAPARKAGDLTAAGFIQVNSNAGALGNSKGLFAYNRSTNANYTLTVRTDGGRLFVQATKQQEYEVFAESERDFFYRVVDAQITFDPAENGQTRTLTLHQNGRDRPGRRVP